MKLRSRKFPIVALALIVCAGAVSAQQYKMAPLAVKKSPFIEEAKALARANPKLTPSQLADAANAILDKQGIGFGIYFDSGSCDKIKKVKEQQKDPSQSLILGATLKSVDADGASLALPEPIFAPGTCGCFIELPLLQITDRDFITILSGRNIRFHMPSNFSTSEVKLIEANDQAKVKRKWQIPFRGQPIGVSHDENVLYLAFSEPELSDLSLAVFGEGVFQIATRTEAEEGGKGKLVDAAASATESILQFDRWGNSYLVRFPSPCR